MNLILFGFKKCGKTYLGLKLAQKMHMQFIDTDLKIEELFQSRYHQKLSCRQIASHHGIKVLREIEKQVIFSLENVDNTVIALGGGAVLDHENVEHLHKVGAMVYLKADKELIKARILSGDIPAYIDMSDPVSSFEQMYETRLPVYESIQAFKVDTRNKSEQDILQILVDLVEVIKVSHGE